MHGNKNCGCIIGKGLSIDLNLAGGVMSNAVFSEATCNRMTHHIKGHDSSYHRTSLCQYASTSQGISHYARFAWSRSIDSHSHSIFICLLLAYRSMLLLICTDCSSNKALYTGSKTASVHHTDYL